MSEKKWDSTTLLIFGTVALASLVLVALILLRIFVFDIYRIPSESMHPTLVSGDWAITSRRAYARRDPEPGDVVVHSTDSGIFIKRVVGLPGQTVAYRDKRLYIDGVAVPTEASALRVEGARARIVAEETLGDYQYEVSLNPQLDGAEGEYIVPEGYYFLLGDNRDNSRDSRHAGVGYIPRAKILGRVVDSLFSDRQGLKPRDNAVRRTALPE